MLKKITINNYKTIDNAEIDVGRINVFIGENGSGKTNILESLAMVSASKGGSLTVEGIYNKGVRIGKPHLTFSSFAGCRQKHNIHIDLEYANESNGHSCLIPSLLYCEDQEDIYAAWKDEYPADSHESRFLSYQAVNTKPHELSDTSWMKPHVEDLKDYVIYHPDILSLRGIRVESRKTPLGIRGENLDIFLSQLPKPEKQQLKDFFYMVSWLDDIVIDEKDALKFDGHKLGRSNSLLYFKDKFMLKKNMNNIFSAENANDGILHILFYLSLFISRKTPAFFAIDNIENSLNPRICRTLVKELAQLSKKTNKQVLITTHNPAVLDGLNIYDDEQRLFVVFRNDDGKTRIKRIQMKPASDESLKLSEMWMRGYLGGLPNNF